MRLRHSAIAKIVAVWFVAMIVLPFTAPFQSYELTDSSSSSSHQALPKDKNDSDDGLVPPSDWCPAPRALNVVVMPRAHSGYVDHRSLDHTVLRL